MSRKLLVCTNCEVAIFLNSSANTAPRWTGKIGDPAEKRIERRGQDDERDFKIEHSRHKPIVVELMYD